MYTYTHTHTHLTAVCLSLPAAAPKPAGPAVPTESFDLVVTATPGDAELVSFLKSKWILASIDDQFLSMRYATPNAPAYCIVQLILLTFRF